MDVFFVIPFVSFAYFFGTMSAQASAERKPMDRQAVESSPGTESGDTPNKGRKKKGDKKTIPEMKLTVDIQKWCGRRMGKQ